MPKFVNPPLHHGAYYWTWFDETDNYGVLCQWNEGRFVEMNGSSDLSHLISIWQEVDYPENPHYADNNG